MTILNQSSWPDQALQRAHELLGYSPIDQLSVFDVGAHQGETLSFFLSSIQPSCKLNYYCFEPDPRSFAILSDFVESSNSQQPNCKICCFEVAVGDINTKINLNQSSSTLVSGILHPEPFLCQRVPDGSHSIISSILCDQITLDSFVANIQPLPPGKKILKIDTEGYDYNVLLGASGLLKQHFFDVVICEFFAVNYRLCQHYLWDLASYLHSFGYMFDNIYDNRNTSQGRLYTGNILTLSPAAGAALDFA